MPQSDRMPTMEVADPRVEGPIVVERVPRTGASADTAGKAVVRRPWGNYRSLFRTERAQIKHIVVKPSGKLSLQMHYHRAEHWVVIQGSAKIVRGSEELTLTENEAIFIPVGMRHRVENPGKIPLHIIEVQWGSYLGEDDIVRFDDAYGRS